MSLPPPVVVYPNTVTPQPGSHSKGSFGPVFIVLAIIIVISAIACCLGQLCARRFSHQKGRKEQREHGGEFRTKDGDIEYGFKKRVPTGKPVGHGEIKDPRHAPHMGEHKEEMRSAGIAEARAST